VSALPRLNRVIAALESGQTAFASFAQADRESAIAMSTSAYDGIIFEMEHNPYDIAALRDGLQYLLNRGQIARAGSVVPAVTPLVRIPPNGAEKAHVHAKQVLDLGAYGVVWPHISSVEEAYNAVAACRYPRLRGTPRDEPAGVRGDGPTAAIRYWGVTQAEYYERADVWPLDPNGEILVILMMEDTRGIENLPEILTTVPGIGAILIGEGDLSQAARRAAAVRAPAGRGMDATRRDDVQGARRSGRPPARRHEERRAHRRRGLPFLDAGTRARLHRSRHGPHPNGPDALAV